MAIHFQFESKDTKIGYKHEIMPVPPNDYFCMHTHNQYEIIYFVRGDATHVIEDRKYKLKPGDLLLIQPMKYHFIQIDSPATCERYIIGVDNFLLGVSLTSLFGDSLEVIDLSKEVEIDRFFHKIDHYLQSLAAEDLEKLFPALMTELIYDVVIASRKKIVRNATVLNPVLSEAIAYINDHLLTLKTISEISDHLFVSESYLFQLFKKEIHQTPKKYITDKRLLLAQTMIRGGERPSDACAKCGFSDYSVFYRSYKSFFKKTPSEDAGI